MIADLKAKALAATPGPWLEIETESSVDLCAVEDDVYLWRTTSWADIGTAEGEPPVAIVLGVFDERDGTATPLGANAQFIAAANPSVILSLLASLEEAEGRETQLLDAIAEASKALCGTWPTSSQDTAWAVGKVEKITRACLAERELAEQAQAALAEANRQIAEQRGVLEWIANHRNDGLTDGSPATRVCLDEIVNLAAAALLSKGGEGEGEGLPERLDHQCGSRDEATVGATAALATQSKGKPEAPQRWQRMNRAGLIETARAWADRQMVEHDTRTDLAQSVREAAFYRADALYEFASHIEDGNFDAVRPALASKLGGGDA